MKKFILTFLLLLIFASPTFAKATQVEAMSEYDSDNPPFKFVFKVIEYNAIENFTSLLDGDIIESEVVKTKDNKRLKQNATFALKITKIIHRNGDILEPDNVFAKYTTALDKVEMSKNVALSVGNYFVKGVSFGYRTIEGAVKNPEGNRFKSGGIALVNSTPLGYINKGEDIKIKVGDKFLLNIKAINLDNPTIIDEYKYDVTKQN